MTSPGYSSKRSVSSSWSGFSLTELLVVMAIITLMAGVITPSLNIGKAQNLTTAGNLVVDLAQQARQNSVSRNVMTALVVANNPLNQAGSSQMFVLLELSQGSSQWVPVSRWTQLPQGVAVDTSESSGFFSDMPTLNPPINLPPYLGNAVTVATSAYQVFVPGGRLSSSGISSPGSPLLRLVEGTLNNQQLQKQNSQNYYDIVINRFTGIPKVDRP